jgi:TPR repeat protein
MNASRLVLPLVALFLGGDLGWPAQQSAAERKQFEEFKAKAEKGDAQAQVNLSDCYRKGEGVPQDAVQAVKWFRQAAAQNFAAAQSNLGICYERGEGVAKYEVEAYKWNLLAAAQGDNKAKRNASMLELMLSREELAEGKRRAQDCLEQRKNSSGNNR